MKEEFREEWGSRSGFILAAVGFAVGIGNLWRFPYICYDNGGGAFLIPYFIALFVCGIPICILELGLGHYMRLSPPLAFRNVNKRAEWVGWWSSIVSFAIVIYYAVILAWCLLYIVKSLSLEWGSDPLEYFNSFIGLTSGPGVMGSINWSIVAANGIVWLAIFLILFKGIRVVGKVVWVTVLAPWVMLSLLVVRALTLPGAVEGLNYYLTPQFDALLDPTVWMSAFSQIFFSVGICWGALIAYSSHLPRKSDIVNNAYIITFGNSATSFIAGFAVFGILGYLSHITGTPVGDLVEQGTTLAFVTYPVAINMMPAGSAIFGILFFLCLFTLGIDSAFGMIEVMADSVHDKWGTSKPKAIGALCVVGFLLGTIFTTGAGIYWLDIVDRFISDFGLFPIGIAECIIVGWLLKTDRLRDHMNEVSEIRVGRFWSLFVKLITPMTLIGVFIWYLIDRINTPYGGYENWALWLGGWGLAIAVPIVAIVMMLRRGRRGS